MFLAYAGQRAGLLRNKTLYSNIRAMLKTAKKQKIIKKSAINDKDTGSSHVQVALLSEAIKELSSHLKTHKKDNHSRRGLIKMVSKRRKHLKYLAKNDKVAYDKIVADLKIS